MSDWKPFFEAIGPQKYLEESFAQHTLGEVDFLLDVCQL